jgi:hypothetical protein
MAKPIQEMSSWEASAQPSRDFDEQNEETWEPTRQQSGLATQLMRNKDEYLAQAQQQVGQQVGESQWELFVVIDPAEALQQQFDLLKPEFVALHDVGTTSSRRLLAGLAMANSRPVHQLHIRRQGLGMALAKLEFVELPVAAGQPPLRLYTTEVDADTQHRHSLARMLLAYSRLAAVIVGDLPPHALATALMPLRNAIKAGPWLNRELLMLPLAGAAALAGQASNLATGTQVQIRTTPQVTRPAEAWTYVRGAWNKVRAQLRDTTTLLPEILDSAPSALRPPAATAPPAATPGAAGSSSLLESSTATPRAPLAMQPMPAVRPSAPMAATADPALATYVRKCGELKGMLSCGVFELATQRTIAHAGTRPGPAALASQGADLMASMAEAAHALNLGDAAPDAAITLGSHHQLLRAVPSRPGLALHAVLDRAVTNLTLVRLQLQRLDLLLEEGDTA